MNKKVILIIGASSDIGCAVIKKIADDSTIIIAHYNSGLEKLTALKSEVAGEIFEVQSDLTSENGVLLLIQSIGIYCESPNKIIFLASSPLNMIRFKDLSWKNFQRYIDFELRTAVMILSQFLPKMAKLKSGRVLFMLSSVTVGVPPSAMAHYVTAKYALQGLMKAVAAEYANKGITINAIAPSMVETKFLADIPGKIIEISADNHPLKRNASVNDIAPLVKYLLSDEAEYITGVTVPVTGGLVF